MNQVLLKAQDFYFSKFLPTVVPIVMIAPSDCTIHYPLVDSIKPDKEFVRVVQHENHARKQGKNLLCSDEQDPMIKATVLKKLKKLEKFKLKKAWSKLILESLDKKLGL